MHRTATLFYLATTTTAYSMAVTKGTHKLQDGTTLPYEVYGTEHTSATPLVLIMGLSGVKEDWHPFVDALATTRPVLIYDRRGIGESRIGQVPDDQEEPDWTLDLEAYDALALLVALGKPFAKVNVLGWSMGGHILQALLVLPEARAHSSGKGVEVCGIHIDNAILAATMPKLPRGEFKPSVMEEIMATADTDPNWKLKATETMMRYQYDADWLADPVNKETFANRVKTAMSTRRPQRIIASQGAAIAQRDTRPDLPRIPEALPVLVIHGRNDRMVAYSESELLLNGIKHARRLDMGQHGDRFGHFYFDSFGADWWASKIDDFLVHGHRQAAKL